MKILVYIEKNPITNMLKEVSIELTAKAYSLLHSLQQKKHEYVEILGVYVGDDLPNNVEKLFEYGMDRLIYSKHTELKYLQSMAYKNIVIDVIKKENPEIVLFGATHAGREVAPLVASTLRTGLTADCTQLVIDNYKDKGDILFQIRPAFGGNILATIITPDTRPMMATVRENVMPIPEHKVNKPLKLEEYKVVIDKNLIKNEFLKIIHKEAKVNLGASQIIVSGGAGVGSKENFNLISALAHALGGEVGASRAAIDFDFIEKDRLIGQTGAVVRPKLYIACGISGSIQHRAGMEESKKIIAINKDQNAPIFKIAHMGIVGDLTEVIPIMLKSLKEE